MFKLVVLLGLLGLALGAPQTKTFVPLLDGRIVGGAPTDISSYPSTVSVQRLRSHICGGALISNSWVLTAAHCVFVNIRYTIRASSTYRNTGGVEVDVRRVIRHPQYSSATINNDIALLELDLPVNAPNAKPVALVPQGGAPTPGAIATITGWGALSEGGPSTNILQVVNVPVVSQRDCRAAYGETAISDKMFCAGLLGVGGKDACQGDSGGPVFIGNLLAGVVSWGAGCARPTHPGVKTNIAPLRSWITETSGI